MMGFWMCSSTFQTNLVVPELFGFAQGDDGAKFVEKGFAGNVNNFIYCNSCPRCESQRLPCLVTKKLKSLWSTPQIG